MCYGYMKGLIQKGTFLSWKISKVLFFQLTTWNLIVKKSLFRIKKLINILRDNKKISILSSI